MPHTDGDERRWPWLAVCFVTSLIVVFFLMFPALWWNALAVIDVRNWRWPVYAIVNVVIILALIALKSRWDA